MKGVDNLWITLWITPGRGVDNPVDNLWTTPPSFPPVDNPLSYSQVIHRETRVFHRGYPQPVSAPGRRSPPLIHISTGPTTTTTKVFKIFKRSVVVVVKGRLEEK